MSAPWFGPKALILGPSVANPGFVLRFDLRASPAPALDRGRGMERIAVFCGSSLGSAEAYRSAAEALGVLLARRGHALVYGGGQVGLMGAVADAVLRAGGTAVGVIPEALAGREIAHAGLSELHVVPTMHARKALMAELSSAFVALPGGFGTLDELFEIVTWGQLGLHRKPVGLLDVGGYFGSLLRFVEHAVAERFVRPEHAELLVVEAEPEALLDRLATHRPPSLPKWISAGET
jgi:uncharacterized protein (TIGR00730 family)